MTDSTPSAESKQTAVLAHLLGIFTNIVGPLIIWIMKRDSDTFTGENAKEALNFQITVAIAHLANGVIGAALGFLGVLLNGLFGFAIWVIVVWWGIAAVVSTNNGNVHRYPFCLRFVR